MKKKVTVIACDMCGEENALPVDLVFPMGIKRKIDLCHKCTLKLFAIYFKTVPKQYHDYLFKIATEFEQSERVKKQGAKK